ncbi:MAG: methyl-accepting chemotaxis protein, partial [Candidatus Margulisiibacteriota bacterium]
MNIRKTLIIFFIIICSFSIATITMAFKLKNTLDDVEKAQTNRHQSLQLADELRQSSDDLTRFARTYVTTGDKKYKKYFQQVLDIRNGILSRPDDYQNVYW